MRKKNDDLRLIFDTRVSNCHFAKPASVDLMGPQGLGDLCCPPGGWELGQGDIRNAFYLCQVPQWLSEYFSLPAVKLADFWILMSSSC